MKTLVLSATLLTMGLSVQAWAWDNGWEDDNGANKKSGTYDPVDIQHSQGSRQGDSVFATFESGNTANYTRLCDVLFEVRAASGDGSVAGTERYHLNKRLLRPFRSFELTAQFQASDWSNDFRLIKDSARVLPTCLRYELPGPVDPIQNPGQRPTQTPNQVCNPEQDPGGCDNTCYGQNTQACAGSAGRPGSNTGWDANDQYW